MINRDAASLAQEQPRNRAVFNRQHRRVARREHVDGFVTTAAASHLVESVAEVVLLDAVHRQREVALAEIFDRIRGDHGKWPRLVRPLAAA